MKNLESGDLSVMGQRPDVFSLFRLQMEVFVGVGEASIPDHGLRVFPVKNDILFLPGNPRQFVSDFIKCLPASF